MMEDEAQEQVKATTDPVTRVFVATLFLSLLLHVGFMVTAFFAFELHMSQDMDVEWLQNFDKLEGLGSSGGRYASVEVTAPVQTKVEEPKVEEPKVEEPKVEEPKVEEPKVEEPKEPKVEEPKVEKPKVEKPKVVKKDPSPTNDEVGKPVDSPVGEPTNPFEAEELPGLRREGPSGLPQMEGYGPGNAIFSALLRLDRVRDTPFEEPVRRIMQVVPDYRIALENTGVDSIRDIDSMFMASAMPQYIQQTFLAVRHRLSDADLKTALDYRYSGRVEWSQYRGHPMRDLVPTTSKYEDPRRILLPRPGLAVLTRPEWLPQLTDTLPEDSELRAGSEADVSMLDGLEQIERAAADDTLLLMSAHGAVVILPGLGRMKFEASRVSIRNVEEPQVDIDITFATAAEAKRFAANCPKMKEALVNGVSVFVRGTVANLVNRVTCETSDRFVAVKATYLTTEIVAVLNMAVMMVPRPPALSQLPQAPPMRVKAVEKMDVPEGDAGQNDADKSTPLAPDNNANGAPKTTPTQDNDPVNPATDAGNEQKDAG